MNVFLTHIDWSPVIYGVCLWLSVMSLGWKLKKQKYVGFIAEIVVVALILIIHGGSVTGGFAATIAGLLSGWCIPYLFDASGKPVEPVTIEQHRSTELTPAEAYAIWRQRHG